LQANPHWGHSPETSKTEDGSSKKRGELAAGGQKKRPQNLGVPWEAYSLALNIDKHSKPKLRCENKAPFEDDDGRGAVGRPVMF